MSISSGKRVGSAWLEAGRSGRHLPVRSVLRLQQTIGNREVLRLLMPPPESTPSAARADDSLKRSGPVKKLAAVWRRLVHGTVEPERHDPRTTSQDRSAVR